MATHRPLLPPNALLSLSSLALVAIADSGEATTAPPPSDDSEYYDPASSSSSSSSSPPISIASIAAIAPSLSLALVLLYVFYPAIRVRFGGSESGVREVALPSGSSGGGPSSSSSSSSRSAKPPPPVLTLVIPSYNEEDRLPTMLDEALDHLRTNRAVIVEMCRSVTRTGRVAPPPTTTGTFEIIVVDDGSNDGTGDVTRRYASYVSGWGCGDTVRLLRQSNGGKGSAVRAGMVRARGELRLMVDADGATEFGSGLSRVLGGMADALGRGRGGEVGSAAGADAGNAGGAAAAAAAVFGSRAHLEEASSASRSPVRTLLMRAFHFFVRNLCSASIRDTQCGFKLFTREAAVPLFANLHLRRWAFDTELVVMAERMGIPVVEVGVRWHEVEGSKLDTSKLTLALVSLSMLRDMVCVRACYALGVWRLKP